MQHVILPLGFLQNAIPFVSKEVLSEMKIDNFHADDQLKRTQNGISRKSLQGFDVHLIYKSSMHLAPYNLMIPFQYAKMSFKII